MKTSPKKILVFPRRRRRVRRFAAAAEPAQILDLDEYRRRAKAARKSAPAAFFPGYGYFFTYWMWVPLWKIS